MKQFKRFALAMIGLLLAFPAIAEQSTQGKDFWVTFMRADGNNPEVLSLTFSSQKACTVTVTSAADPSYQQVLNIAANGVVKLDSISKNLCYVSDNEAEASSNHSLHIVATEEISVIAANYKKKSFDVAAVLPTPSLKDEYRIQCYTPSSHDGTSQGSHFAIVAVEDNTVVDFCPTVMTYQWNNAFVYANTPNLGDTLTTPVLNKGDVYYIWTGNGEGVNYDLSGTYVKARNNKPIAVFNGNPHTNIPKNIRNRDHLYSQAMPTIYWGTRFPLTSTLTTITGKTDYSERVDKIRVQALHDGTMVYINDSLVHTFDFVNGSAEDKKHYWEFELGTATDMDNDPYHSGIYREKATSCFLRTSCASAVHVFMVSNRYDHTVDKDKCNGDPSMVWVNPIEQVINEITYAPFTTNQVKDHFINIVTETSNVNSMTLDGSNIASYFQPLNGNSNYKFARLTAAQGVDGTTHTIKGDAGFIATAYGFGELESYGFPAGGATKPVEQYVYINGVKFSPTVKNTLCGLDSITFSVTVDYPTDSVVWGFGDGTPKAQGDTVKHLYPKGNVYNAYCLIYFTASDVCGSMGELKSGDTIWIEVNTQELNMTAKTPDRVCADQAEKLAVTFTNNGGNLAADSIVIILNDPLNIIDKDTLVFQDINEAKIELPESMPVGTYSGVAYFHTEKCGSDTVDFTYHISYPMSVIQQRWSDVLGVTTKSAQSPHNCYDLSGATFQWYKNGELIPGATSSVLYETLDPTADYTVEITRNGESQFSCPFRPKAYTGSENEIKLKNFYAQPDGTVTLITGAPARALVHSTEGHHMSTQEVGSGLNAVRMPGAAGLYVLKVITEEGEVKSFKVIVK